MTNDYIRRQDVLNLPKTKVRNFKGEVIEESIDIDDVKELEPTDVVPVVRCENCVHWSDSNQCERPELAGNRWHDDKYFETLPDDFCSYGKRKE